ncbi:hypothetical protein J1N35_039944 [Gossypium stocksii]|uniref:Uncharacterized protein n=1 Tax=Gossypium stocksii TaxID=47602 RepID=A0A9D3ZHV3_9ROSI|nr:hypothetical protein J1N35_039944 [Gossypium stocksii]
MAPEVFDEEHKVDLRKLHTNWLRYWSHYTREPIIIPQLACVLKYMPWFRIYGKPHSLLEEERRRQILTQKER